MATTRTARSRCRRRASPSTSSGAPPGCRSTSTECSGSGLLLPRHVDRLEALRALLDLELDELVLEQATAAFACDLRVVHEDVGPFILLDEAPPLLIVEPLHPAHCHRIASTSTLSTRPHPAGARPLRHPLQLPWQRGTLGERKCRGQQRMSDVE